MSHAHPEIEALLDYTDQLNGLVSGHQQEVSQLLNVNEQLQPDWNLVLTMQENEMFVLGMEEDEFYDAIEMKDYAALNKHLYRVQKVSSKFWCFRYHTETTVDDKYGDSKNEQWSFQTGKAFRASSFDGLFRQFPHKVKIDIMGRISKA